jgi:hypothetical protein
MRFAIAVPKDVLPRQKKKGYHFIYKSVKIKTEILKNCLEVHFGEDRSFWKTFM